MYIITFYSFKGGVGRTMALVNTGAELARRGKKVLLVDFDLEAPGLSTYDLLAPKKEGHPGIVEFVTEYRETHRSPLVTDFIYEAKKDRRIDKKGGKLWVMPAGRGDAEYRRKLNNISWRTLYEKEEGFLLFEDTRLQWEAELHPDYVLIDARTGHTDIEGICTRQLADAVVVVFYPNEQNLKGLKQVVRTIRAEEASGLEKKIKLHFVASNVPDLDDERGILRRQLKLFRNHLDSYRHVPRLRRLVIHRTESLRMLEQPVFVLQRPRSRLAREYRWLVRWLMMENPVEREGALFYLQGLEQDRELRDMWQSARFGGVDERLHQIESCFRDDPTVLRRLARWYEGLGELDLAVRQYDRILELQPGDPVALFERGQRRRQIRDKVGAASDFFQCLHSGRELAFRESVGGEDDGMWRNQARSLQELIGLSFETFLQALTLPWLRDNRYILGNDDIWLHSPAEYLLRERRWEDAIQYLEIALQELLTTIRSMKPEPNGPFLRVADENNFRFLQGERAWYLAMADWGKTGKLNSGLCRKALGLLHETLDKFTQQDAKNLQRLSLLHWGIGEPEKATTLLDRALEDSSKLPFDRGISEWTFREASWHEFHQHCEQQRRMIQGEPIRPPFLGPPS